MVAIVLLMLMSVWIVAQVGRIVVMPPEPRTGGKVVQHDERSITVLNARAEQSVYTITPATEVVRGRERVPMEAISNGMFVLVEASSEADQALVAKRIVILPGARGDERK